MRECVFVSDERGEKEEAWRQLNDAGKATKEKLDGEWSEAGYLAAGGKVKDWFPIEELDEEKGRCF